MQYLKAIVGAATAGLSARTALLDSSVAPVEWVGVAGAALGTLRAGVRYAEPSGGTVMLC